MTIQNSTVKSKISKHNYRKDTSDMWYIKFSIKYYINFLIENIHYVKIPYFMNTPDKFSKLKKKSVQLVIRLATPHFNHNFNFYNLSSFTYHMPSHIQAQATSGC